MNLLPSKDQYLIAMSDMMGQPLRAGDVVWRFYTSGSGYYKTLMVVAKCTPTRVTLLEKECQWSNNKSNIAPQNCLLHEDHWHALPEVISGLQDAIDTFQEENK